MKKNQQKILLSEYAHYDELLEGLQAVNIYGTDRWQAVEKYIKDSKKRKFDLWQTVWTPGERSFPGLYVYQFDHGNANLRVYLCLEGKDGDSYAMVQYPEPDGDVTKLTKPKCVVTDPSLRNEEDFIIEVLHGHAIRRYIERHGWSQGYHAAQKHIFEGIRGQSLQPDPTDDTYYCYFDGGVLLGKPADGGRVIHLRTFIMNSQCFPVQRMKSLQSEKERELYIEKFGKELL